MATKKGPKNPTKQVRRTNILGMRMSPERVAEVKAEAARRHLTVSKLFDEIWALYLEKRKS